jgi:hypothetical protein
MRAWRDVLLRRKSTTGIYTLHGFLVPADEENGRWEAALGGQIAYANGLVLTRTGPLTIIGLLQKDFSEFEARQWSAIEILTRGGRLRVVRKSDHYWAISPALANALNHTGRWCNDRTLSFHRQGDNKSS